MLGWMLKRGGDTAPVAAEEDNTQIDQPDTPAPVFAARAFKSALFGTPAARPEPRPQQKNPNANMDQGSHTPSSKPQGILLTPGTGTSRPKRVSFGREVKGNRTDSDTLMGKGGTTQKRTHLNEVLESARQKKSAGKSITGTSETDAGPSDDEWEEDDGDAENFCNHDITLDLNEPHSQSGRFWKEEYEKYHQDAKVELEKMLKYKRLVKSYAQQKDAEAIGLAEKLRIEQQKVINMERKIAENASQIISQSENTAEDASPELVAKLTKQTALAVQYRQRVQGLEDQLEEFLEGRNDDAETKGRRRRAAASPRTTKTLLEAQKELRKARNQVKELDSLRQEVLTLRDQLRAAECAVKAEVAPTNEGTENVRAKDLRTQLRSIQEESRKKDEEIRQLKMEFEEFRQERQAHEQDSNAVLERAQGKIADLKKEIKALKGIAPEPSSRPVSWHPQSDNKEHDEEVATTAAESPVKVYSTRARSTSRRAISNVLDDTSGRKTSALSEKPQTLRDKFRHDATDPSLVSERNRTMSMSGALADRPSLEKPRWQPFVPRSPRNRAYLGEDVSNQIQNGGGISTVAKPKTITAPDLPALARTISRSDGVGSGLKAEAKIDLLSDRFAKLGGPEMSSRLYTTTNDAAEKALKSKLPPERRAAAMARIEQGRAEKKTQRHKGLDKENMRP